MENEKIEFDRQGMDPNLPKEILIAFVKAVLKLEPKQKTGLLQLDFDNIKANFPKYHDATLAEHKFLTEEKNAHLDKLPGILDLILSKGKANLDSDKKDIVAVSKKVVKICSPYSVGSKTLDHGRLDQRYAKGLGIKTKLEDIGEEGLELIGAGKQFKLFSDALDGYNDTKEERNAYLASLKGKTVAYKAALVKDLRGLFNSIPSVQHKTGYKENIFTRELNKLITNTKAKASKPSKDSDKDSDKTE